MRAELLGVRLVGSYGGGPIDLLEIPFSTGLTALAGLNGAGKSRILRGLSCALSGRKWSDGRWELFFRVADGEGLSRRLERTVGLWLAFARTRADGFDFADTEALDGDYALDALERADVEWRVWLAEYLQLAVARIACSPAERLDLVAALAASAVFAICSTDDRLVVRVALDRGVEDPAVARWSARLDAAVDYELSLYEPAGAPSDEQINSSKARPLGPFGPANPIDYVVDSRRPKLGDLLPVPLFQMARLGVRQNNWLIDVADLAVAADVDALTNELLSRFMKSDDAVAGVLAGQQDASDAETWGAGDAPLQSITAAAARVGRVATRLYSELLGDPVVLRCRVHPVATWLDRGYGFSWEAQPQPQHSWIGIGDLSPAQQRWARFAMVVALGRVSSSAAGRGTWVIADEPETGVHRTAESRLARRLRTLASEPGIGGLLVATHSSRLIESAHTAFLVKRGAGRDHMRPMPARLIDVADELGLEITDLLGWYRQVLFVEGAHDEAVVRAFLSDELDRTRTLMIPLRGLRESGSVVDATLLDYVVGPAAFVIDGLGLAAEAKWGRVVELLSAGDRVGATKAVNSSFSSGAFEDRFLKEIGLGVVENGRHDQFSVQALSVPDIVDLLPVDQVLGTSAASWADVHAAYEAAKRSGHRVDPFKRWAAKNYRAPEISPDRLGRIASEMQVVPDDIQRVAALLVLLAKSDPVREQ